MWPVLSNDFRGGLGRQPPQHGGLCGTGALRKKAGRVWEAVYDGFKKPPSMTPCVRRTKLFQRLEKASMDNRRCAQGLRKVGRKFVFLNRAAARSAQGSCKGGRKAFKSVSVFRLIGPPKKQGCIQAHRAPYSGSSGPLFRLLGPPIQAPRAPYSGSSGPLRRTPVFRGWRGAWWGSVPHLEGGGVWCRRNGSEQKSMGAGGHVIVYIYIYI